MICTIVVPIMKESGEENGVVMVGIEQLSVAVGSSQDTSTLQAPLLFASIFGGQLLSIGGTWSRTDTIKEQESALPEASVTR